LGTLIESESSDTERLSIPNFARRSKVKQDKALEILTKQIDINKIDIADKVWFIHDSLILLFLTVSSATNRLLRATYHHTIT
jgi:hypothetical protein